MAGLDPAIHVFASVSQGLDARHEAGMTAYNIAANFAIGIMP
jgi:hypothetical protein